MLGSQLALIAVPGVIFALLGVLFVYKAMNICLYGSSGVAEMRTQARTTHMRTRGTQTRETRGEHDTTVFL